jgi:sugar phosphate isomerase/epimerase
MQLGLVTYNLAKDWDLSTLIENCEKTGFAGVELRTTHAHGVEPELDSAGREQVRRRFEQTPVRLLSFGTTCEFHSADPAEVRRHITRCGEFVRLAQDVGALGVKVRPNGFPEGVTEEKTLEQIGHALRECGEVAAAAGVQIWLEVHGCGTCQLPHIRTILDHADHPNVLACWNSNQADKDDNGAIEANFARVAARIGSVHINELYRADYPYRTLFRLLRESGYQGFCLAELGQTSPDALTLMRYYRALFEALGGSGTGG